MLKLEQKVEFLGQVVDVYVGWYESPRNIAVKLIHPTQGPWANATSNHPLVSADLDGPVICVKNHSENEGMVEALKEVGLIGEMCYEVESGWVRLPVYQWLGPVQPIEDA